MSVLIPLVLAFIMVRVIIYYIKQPFYRLLLILLTVIIFFSAGYLWFRAINLPSSESIINPAGEIVVTSSPWPSSSTLENIASPTSSPLSVRTKTGNCVINGAYPDLACTPGQILDGITAAKVCEPGYSASVRDVPDSEKDAVYAEYNISSRTPGQYEIDHFISLELGGSNDISNLFPEAASPTPGFHEKDKVENYLHTQVCKGALPLQAAQQEIASDWVAIYNQIK